MDEKPSISPDLPSLAQKMLIWIVFGVMLWVVILIMALITWWVWKVLTAA